MNSKAWLILVALVAPGGVVAAELLVPEPEFAVPESEAGLAELFEQQLAGMEQAFDTSENLLDRPLQPDEPGVFDVAASEGVSVAEEPRDPMGQDEALQKLGLPRTASREHLRQALFDRLLYSETDGSRDPSSDDERRMHDLLIDLEAPGLRGDALTPPVNPGQDGGAKD